MKLHNKLTAAAITASLGLVCVAPVYAEDYSDENYWYSVCTKPQTTSDGVKACEGFQAYTKQKREQLKSDIAGFASSIQNLQGETDKVAALAQEQKQLADQLSSQIAVRQEAITQLETNIAALQQEIDQRQAQIDAWDAQIKSRMRSEQGSVGTNMLLDLIMGASDLNDMLRRLNGIERITEDDQAQIDELNQLKAQLELQKSEMDRLKQDNENQKAELEDQKAQAKALEDSYNQLVAEYEAQIAQLQAQKRAAEADMNSIRDFVISSASYAGGGITAVSGFSSPIPGGTFSAGTWAYPGGGLHLGLDWAASIGTPVLAPADGIILYANNPVPSNNGYLGNFCGYPAGGGNTVEMLCNVNGTLYAVSFAHLAQEGMSVSAGQTVAAGQQIALTGNSGNSTGPHCHIEVYNLGSMSVDEAVRRFSSNADFAWGTGWGSTATACENTGSAPCRERPEKFFR